MGLLDFIDTQCNHCTYFLVVPAQGIKSQDGKACLTWKCAINSPAQWGKLMPLPLDGLTSGVDDWGNVVVGSADNEDSCPDFEWEGES